MARDAISVKVVIHLADDSGLRLRRLANLLLVQTKRDTRPCGSPSVTPRVPDSKSDPDNIAQPEEVNSDEA